MTRLRIFVDSNIVVGAMVQGWALDMAVLSVCTLGICILVLDEAVRLAVEDALLAKVDSLPKGESDRILGSYEKFIRLAKAETVAFPEEGEILANRRLIRHGHDVPVLLSAIKCRPDWLLTKNTEHFTREVARITRLPISTPWQFLATCLVTPFRHNS